MHAMLMLAKVSGIKVIVSGPSQSGTISTLSITALERVTHGT
jgi:hypothetical protein